MRSVLLRVFSSSGEVCSVVTAACVLLPADSDACATMHARALRLFLFLVNLLRCN